MTLAASRCGCPAHSAPPNSRERWPKRQHPGQEILRCSALASVHGRKQAVTARRVALREMNEPRLWKNRGVVYRRLASRATPTCATEFCCQTNHCLTGLSNECRSHVRSQDPTDMAVTNCD